MLCSLLLPSVGLAAGDEEEPIVVDGQRRDPGDPAEAGESVTIVPLDTRLPPGSDVGDAVARAPGTTVRRLGGLGAYAAVSLRGSAQRQVQIHLDGLPLNPDGSSAINLAALPLAAMDRIVVWRGAGPPALAASPIGGVVDLRTAREDSPLSIGIEGGSWTTARAQLRGSATLGSIRILGGATALTSEADFWAFDDNGTATNRADDQLRRRIGNDRRQATGLLQVRGAADQSWRVLTAVSAREEGLSGPINLDPIGRLRSLWGLASVGRPLGAESSVRAWVQGREERITPVAASRTTDHFVQTGLHASTVRTGDRVALGGTAQVRVDAFSPGDGSANAARLSATAVPYLTWRPTRRTRLEPVAHTQLLVDRRPGEQRNRLAFNPRLSLRTRPHPRWVFHAAAGRALRPPDFLELYGNRGATQGRPDLLPETSVWADAGLRYLGEDWNAELTAFGSDAQNRIVFTSNGTVFVPINADPSSVGGVEIGASRQVPWGDARFAMTWTETRVRRGANAGKRLPRIPRVASQIDVGVQPVDAVRVGLSADLIGSNAWDSANRFTTPHRLLLSGQLQIDPGGRWPAIHIGLRNLANRMVQAGPAPNGPQRILRPLTDFTGYPLPGRTLVAGITWMPRRPQDPPP